MTFRSLAGDAPDMLTRVARFLALLELFREGAVSFDQVTPLGELTVRWTGDEDGEVEITDEFDGAPADPTQTHEGDPRKSDGSTENAREELTGRQDEDRSQDGRQQDDARPRTETAETLDVPLAELRPALEAVLMVADQPLDHVTLAQRGRLPAAAGRGRRSTAWPRSTPSRAAASTCATSPAAGATTPARSTPRVVERFVLEGQQARLTQAALETLAVVAYKQPVSRARVSAVRGVNVDGVMRTLVSRGLVEEAGNDRETTATLYRTTCYFLERIGVTSLDDLPELAPLPAGPGRPRRPRLRRFRRADTDAVETACPTSDRHPSPTRTAWSGCRSCSPSPGWPAAASARS